VRAFAALPLPAHVRDALTQACASARASSPWLRWVQPEQWHVTVAFYGDVPDGRVDDLAARLARAARRTAPLPLLLGGVGTFDSRRGPHVAWMGVAGAADDDARRLQRLAAASRAAGRRAGLTRSDLRADRTYRPHLTLARARDAADLSSALTALPPLPPLGWTADALLLVRSDLGAGPAGAPTHRVVASLPFSASAR
jgi:2'-5' RNA ligase